jgi:hypothetical protein
MQIVPSAKIEGDQHSEKQINNGLNLPLSLKNVFSGGKRVMDDGFVKAIHPKKPLGYSSVSMGRGYKKTRGIKMWKRSGRQPL